VTAGAAPGRAAGRARTIFFGSGAFAVPILDAVAAHPRLELVAVVTAPDRPAGRHGSLTPTPVAARARTRDLPLLQPATIRDPQVMNDLGALRPDLGILADYGRIIPRALLDLPAHGIIGVHPSLLPRHRGATPVEATIREGDTEAGVAIYRMDAGLDTGPIIATNAWPLDGTETAPSLAEEAAARGAACLSEVVSDYLDGAAVPVPQAATTEVATTRLQRADAALDPARPAAELERRIRAHAGWPGSVIETAVGRLVVVAARIAPGASGSADAAAGTIVEVDGRPALVAGDGARLVLERVVPAGSREMAGAEFLRGRRSLVGTMVLAPATVSAR
jgi:methionyl-tRNA formyltransferase